MSDEFTGYPRSHCMYRRNFLKRFSKSIKPAGLAQWSEASPSHPEDSGSNPLVGVSRPAGRTGDGPVPPSRITVHLRFPDGGGNTSRIGGKSKGSQRPERGPWAGPPHRGRHGVESSVDPRALGVPKPLCWLGPGPIGTANVTSRCCCCCY